MPRLVDAKEVLTTPQVCDLLNITRQTLYAWLQQGKVKPWMRGGGSWLFIRAEILKAKDFRYQRIMP
ncbi:MAG: helix-turn-helix domain-containing protein [Elusimicrobia bacterium]|nr:helix-turn-helix domain-containing protein [Elusimicrobiota bacterium]